MTNDALERTVEFIAENHDTLMHRLVDSDQREIAALKAQLAEAKRLLEIGRNRIMHTRKCDEENREGIQCGCKCGIYDWKRGVAKLLSQLEEGADTHAEPEKL